MMIHESNPENHGAGSSDFLNIPSCPRTGVSLRDRDVCVSAISMSTVVNEFGHSGQSVHSETLCFWFCRATISCPLNRGLVRPNCPKMGPESKTMG